MDASIRLGECIATVAFTSLVFCLVGCDTSPTDQGKQTTAPDRQLLETQRHAFAEAYNRNDASAWAAFYCEDAEFIAEAGTVHRGRDAIEKLFARVFAVSPGIRVTPSRTNERFITPQVLLEDGTWTFANRNDGGPVEGRYVTIWVHRDGRWCLLSHRNWVPTKPADK